MDISFLFVSFAVLLFSLSVHEAAHAWTASRLGDPTARLMGRVSLNPLVHIDPVGTVLLPLVAYATGAPIIGWARPGPVNIDRLRRRRRDFVRVAAAGPLSNVLIAGLASVALRLLPEPSLAAGQVQVGEPLTAIASAAFQLNLLLAVFNLVPVPPLDGGNIVGGLLRGPLSRRFDALRPWGVFILYGLMLSGMLGKIIGPPYFLLARLLTL